METDEMRNPRRQGQGLVLVITSFLFSLIIAPHVAPAVLGEVLISPDEIEKASNLSTSTID
jgi:hypothetical protein